MKKNKPKLISLVEWAKRHKINPRTARRMASEGRIKTLPMPFYIQGIYETDPLPSKQARD